MRSFEFNIFFSIYLTTALWINPGMAVANKEDIDFAELEKELEAAIDQDTRYWLQNDAKIRAVNQRVATYDEFRYGSCNPPQFQDLFDKYSINCGRQS